MQMANACWSASKTICAKSEFQIIAMTVIRHVVSRGQRCIKQFILFALRTQLNCCGPNDEMVLVPLCTRFHSRKPSYLQIHEEEKEGVELKRYHSGRVDRMNAFSVSTDVIYIAKVMQNLAPSIITYIFWWIKAKNITILIMHCASFQMLKHFRLGVSFFIFNEIAIFQ